MFLNQWIYDYLASMDLTLIFFFSFHVVPLNTSGLDLWPQFLEQIFAIRHRLHQLNGFALSASDLSSSYR